MKLIHKCRKELGEAELKVNNLISNSENSDNSKDSR